MWWLWHAQERFRTEDLDRNGVNDYGDLGSLFRAGLIDSELAHGMKYGYAFEVRPSRASPEYRWMGVANPSHPSVDDRSFLVNHIGTIYYRHGLSNLNEDCEIPPDARRLDE